MTIPKPPSGLLKTGKDAWDIIWSNESTKPIDAILATQLCRKLDRIATRTAFLKKNGDMIGINISQQTGQPTNWVAHPYVKLIMDDEKSVVTTMRELGLTPKVRAELSLDVDKEPDAVDIFLGELRDYDADNGS